jgi:predicted TIM-barrel fold metal-dependent hydrolase
VIVDTHSHYMPKALMRALERRDVDPRIVERDGQTIITYGPRSTVPMTPFFYDLDRIIERMDEAGIDHAILSVTIPGVDWLPANEAEDVADACNSETADIVARYPLRFSGLATVPLQSPERAVEVLRRAAGSGLRGAMIFSNVAGLHLDEVARRCFFDAAAELDLPVLLHPTYPLCAPTVAVHGMIEIAGFLFDTTTAALRLVFDGLYDRHPEFKLIVPHAGSLIPYFIGRIDHFGAARSGSTGTIRGAASDHIRNFYVDSVTDWPPAIQLCLDFFGVDHILFGTDHPFWLMPGARTTLELLHLAPSDRAKIEHLNAARIFRLPVKA